MYGQITQAQLNQVAFEEGQAEFATGGDKYCNPYHEDQDQYYHWDDGYNYAEKEAEFDAHWECVQNQVYDSLFLNSGFKGVSDYNNSWLVVA